MLSSLATLGPDTSSEKRRELLRSVSDLFARGAEAHSDRDVLVFGEVLEHLIDKAELEDRIAFAARHGRHARLPRRLARKLADDVIEVAAPVLEGSPVLEDSDLVAVASRQGQRHLAAISRRASLCEAVTDILVERGDETVLTLVAGNLGARLSATGLSGLLEKSAEAAGVADALACRGDLPTGPDCPIVAMLSPRARERLQALLERDPDRLRSIFEGAFRLLETARKDHRRRRVSAKVLATDIRDGRVSIDDTVIALVAEKRIADVVVVLASLGEIPEAHVRNALHKQDAAAIAATCRAVGMAEHAYRSIVHMRCARLGIDEAEIGGLLAQFRALDSDEARRAIRFHRVRVKASTN